jgi:predicted O-methyltransferase YrrM
MSVLDRFSNGRAELPELQDFLRSLSNIEIGGTRLYDGSGTHFMQNAFEFGFMLSVLMEAKENKSRKYTKFLEFGWSTGIAHTIVHKVLKPEESVAVDLVVPSGMSTETFFANLRFKNLTFLANDSTSTFVKNKLQLIGPFDFIFIDGGHEYKTVLSDFQLALDVASPTAIIALHDIHAEKPSEVSILWNEIITSERYETVEILDDQSLITYGIGLVNLASDGLFTKAKVYSSQI